VLICRAGHFPVTCTCFRAPRKHTRLRRVRLTAGKAARNVRGLLTAILDACLIRDIHPMPNRIVVDYETAIHNAIKSVISPDISIHGCFFHLTQATWRRIRSSITQRAINALTSITISVIYMMRLYQIQYLHYFIISL